jgi:hypothetical protein
MFPDAAAAVLTWDSTRMLMRGHFGVTNSMRMVRRSSIAGAGEQGLDR